MKKERITNTKLLLLSCTLFLYSAFAITELTRRFELQTVMAAIAGKNLQHSVFP